jgi:hypothetical protein
VLTYSFKDFEDFQTENALDALKQKVQELVNTAEVEQVGAETGFGRENEDLNRNLDNLTLDQLRRLTASKADRLCSEEIVAVPPVAWDGETGDSELSAIKYCGFLFTTYKVEYWWFEVFDMLRKLVLSAMLIFVDHPNVRLVVGLLVSFFCLTVVFFTRPLVSASLDILMLVSLVTQTVTLICKSPPCCCDSSCTQRRFPDVRRCHPCKKLIDKVH